MAGAVLASVLVMSIAVFSPIQGGFATTNTMIDNNQKGNASTELALKLACHSQMTTAPY